MASPIRVIRCVEALPGGIESLKTGPMPIQLKSVDVAVIGLGAAGGVAVLPLARAGLKVASIEAGTWMGPRDYRADEI